MKMSIIEMDRMCYDARKTNSFPTTIFEDIVVFRFKSVQYSNNSYMFSCIINMQVTFVEKTQLKIICFPNYKH